MQIFQLKDSFEQKGGVGKKKYYFQDVNFSIKVQIFVQEGNVCPVQTEICVSYFQYQLQRVNSWHP